MAKRDDIVLAIAARKVRLTQRPEMPAPGQASVERMGMVARCMAAFDAGDPVFQIIAEAELRGAVEGTAAIDFSPVLEGDLELFAARAVGTLTNGITQQIVEQSRRAIAPSIPDLGAKQG